jgi:hypothetical protein
VCLTHRDRITDDGVLPVHEQDGMPRGASHGGRVIVAAPADRGHQEVEAIDRGSQACRLRGVVEMVGVDATKVEAERDCEAAAAGRHCEAAPGAVDHGRDARRLVVLSSGSTEAGNCPVEPSGSSRPAAGCFEALMPLTAPAFCANSARRTTLVAASPTGVAASATSNAGSDSANDI